MNTVIRTSVLVLGFSLPTIGCGDGDAASPPGRADAGTSDAAQDVPASDSQPDARTDVVPDVVDSDVTVEAACSETSAPDAPDAPDAKGEDSNCDGADGTVGIDVYLDPDHGDDSNSGTPQAPVATIARAVELASARDGAVLIADGVLAPNPLSLDTGLTVFGGYDSSFLGEPQRHRTTIQTGAEGWIIESSGSVDLHGLTIQGADAEGATGHGASAFAFVLHVADAVLQDVDLQAGDAVSGTSGEPGEPGKSGIDAAGKQGATGLTCFFAAQPDYTEGANGSEANAYGQPAGDLASATAPQMGQAGYPGTDGTNASGAPELDDGTLFFGVAGPGLGDGTAGYGGPGGGGAYYAGSCVEHSGAFYTVHGGGGGTGGCPGWGGQPGTSGGASVALLVRAGTVTVQASRLATGFGGAGGDGGAGGTGGKGGRGAPPYVSSHATSCYDPGTTVDMPAMCPPDETGMGCAGYGSAGGNGGDGGQGGGGAGGWTIGVLTVGGAAADLDSATAFDLGKPGIGGMGGAARAPDGQKASSHQIDL